MRKNRSCVPTRKSIWQTLYAVTKEISWLDHLSSIWEHHLSKWSDTDILFWAVRVSGWLVLEVVATQWEVQAVSLSSEMMEWSLLKVLYSFLFTFVCSDNVRVRDDNCANHKWGGGGGKGSEMASALYWCTMRHSCSLSSWVLVFEVCKLWREIFSSCVNMLIMVWKNVAKP